MLLTYGAKLTLQCSMYKVRVKTEEPTRCALSLLPQLKASAEEAARTSPGRWFHQLTECVERMRIHTPGCELRLVPISMDGMIWSFLSSDLAKSLVVMIN